MSIKVNGKIVAGRGADGKSAYQVAVDGGYDGTEIEFNDALAKINDLPTDAYTKSEADQKFATNASVTSISNTVNNLQTVVNGHTTDISNLESSMTAAKGEIDSLQSDVADLQGDFSTFATKTEVEAVDTKAEQAQQTAETANTAASQASTTATQAKNTANSANTTANSALSKSNTNADDIDDIDQIINRISGTARACWCSVGNRRSGAIVFSSGCWLPNRTTGGTVFSTVIGHLMVKAGDTIQIGTNVPGFFSGINGANVYGLDGTQLSGTSSVTSDGKGININITRNGLTNPRGIVISYSAPSA